MVYVKTFCLVMAASAALLTSHLVGLQAAKELIRKPVQVDNQLVIRSYCVDDLTSGDPILVYSIAEEIREASQSEGDRLEYAGWIRGFEYSNSIIVCRPSGNHEEVARILNTFRKNQDSFR